MSFGFYARCLFVLPEGVAGVPQIEQETVSQFALSLVHVRNELKIHLSMLCRVVVGMPGPAGQGLQESVAVSRPEVDVGTVLAVIPVCPAYAALFRIGHRGLAVCLVPWDTLYEARAPFRVVAGTQRCRMGVRAFFILYYQNVLSLRFIMQRASTIHCF